MSKRRNRLLVLTLAMALVLSMTACSSTPASNSSSSQSSSSSTPEPSSPEPTPSLTAPDREYTRGVISGNEYVNEFWGLKFVAPSEDIMIATQEQMAELLGYGADAMGTDPETMEMMKQQLAAYELCAVDMTTGSTLMIMTVDLTMSGISADIYIKGILESVKASSGAGTVELANDGTPVKEMIAGKEYTSVSYTIKAENVPDNCQTQRLIVDGKRALMVSTTYPPAIEASKAKEQELLAAVTALDDAV